MDEAIVKRCGSLVEAEVDGELVALHVENGTCYGFNGTATRIWSMLQEPKRVRELRDALVAEYEVDPEVCQAQLLELLRDLEKDGLVEMGSATTGA